MQILYGVTLLYLGLDRLFFVDNHFTSGLFNLRSGSAPNHLFITPLEQVRQHDARLDIKTRHAWTQPFHENDGAVTRVTIVLRRAQQYRHTCDDRFAMVEKLSLHV